MGKKEKNKKNNLVGVNFGDKSVVQMITNNLNKHGRIRGKNKKETKAMQEACPHHVIDRKKGKIKRKYSYNSETNTCTCKLCGKSWSATVENFDKLDKHLDKTDEYINQAKLFNVANGGGEHAQKYLAETAIHVGNFRKTYKKLGNAVLKQDKFKKKKKDNRNSGSSQYGSWR